MDHIQDIYKGFKSFNKYILINGDVSERELDTFFNRYPQFIVYLASYAMTRFGSYTEIEIEYTNTHIDFKNIFVVNSINEILNVYNFYLRRYDESIAFVSKKDLSIHQEILDKHSENLFAIYPYLKQISYNTVFTSNIGGFNYGVAIANLVYHVSPLTLKKLENDIDQAVTRISKTLFKPDMPKEVKIFLAHNYLSYIADYDQRYIDDKTAFDPYSQSAYGVLIVKKAVCQGFADAFKRIMTRGGIWCDMVIGSVNDVPNETHAWNIVKLDDGCYYHVDVTFDDLDETIFDYFLVNDYFMSSKRKWAKKNQYPCLGKRDWRKIVREYIIKNKTRLYMSGIPLAILNVNF